MTTGRPFIPALTAVPATLGQPRRPNFLFLHTDDQRFDTIRALGNGRILPPTMDRLAGRGVSLSTETSTPLNRRPMERLRPELADASAFRVVAPETA
jgi:hypothetical protein